LATESWDRFLPQFRKRHLKTSQRTAKKNEKIAQKVEARKAAGLETTVEELTRKEATKKKVYTPFPPAQLPRKVDLQLESGEYFLKASDKEAREIERRKQRQAEATEKRRVERAEAFVAPVEVAAPTVEEKRRHRKRTAGDMDGEETEKAEKIRKKKKKRREKEDVQEDDES